MPGTEKTFKILRERLPGPHPSGPQSRAESVGLPTEAQGAAWVASPGWRAAILLFCTPHPPSGNWRSIPGRVCQPERLLLLLKEQWRKPTGAKDTKGRAPMCGAVRTCGAPSVP